LGKSSKKLKRYDEIEDKAHHTFKKQKIAVAKKQTKQVDRLINKVIKYSDPKSLHNEYDLENYV